MQLLAGQGCKKDYPSYHLQIWSFYTRKHNLPTQWFPRQFSIDIHLFHLIPEKLKSQIGNFFLPREKLSSLTLYDALVVLSLELEHSYTEHWRSAVCAACGDNSNWNVNVLFFKRTVSTSVARAREAINHAKLRKKKKKHASFRRVHEKRFKDNLLWRSTFTHLRLPSLFPELSISLLDALLCTTLDCLKICLVVADPLCTNGINMQRTQPRKSMNEWTRDTLTVW